MFCYLKPAGSLKSEISFLVFVAIISYINSNCTRSDIMALKPELIEVLACPKCKTGVRVSKNGKSIVCDTCRLVYEIKDEIPVMLIDEAKQVENTEEY